MNSVLNPYISFNGRAREAMEFYNGVFGGELTISTFADQGVTTGPADGVMHAQLTVDGKPLLMGSDGMDAATVQGVSLSLSGDNAEELRDYFAKISDGGQVTKPLEKESWGDEFGMCVDKYGLNWMVNIAAAKQ